MTTGIVFSYIPSNLAAPGQLFEVNSGGQYQRQTRVILLGYKTSGGSLAVATPTAVASQNDADALAGPRSMLREMFRLASANAPAQPFWLLAVDAPATAAAAKTMTVANLPAPGQGVIEVCGRPVTISVTPADTIATVAAALAAGINGYYDTLTNAMLPVLATAAAGVVTVTAVHGGDIMNDIDIAAPASGSNVLAAAGVVTIAQTVVGSGAPDISAALGALGDDPADFVVSPFSDAASRAAAAAAFNDVSGRWAWSRQSYGHYWTMATGAFSALMTLGGLLNDRHLTVVGRWVGSLSPSWELAAARAAAESTWLSDITLGGVSRNQTGRVVEGVRGPRDRSVLWGYSARSSLINAGISTSTIDAYGNVCVDKTVTTYKTGSSGQPDTVFRDIQSVYQASLGLSYIRAVIAQEHGQKSFAESNPGNLGAISTPADIKATFIHAYSTMVVQGVFQDVDAMARNIVVKANASNPARCDVLLPIERVNPLDIIAVNATFYQAFPGGF